jgi:hypothetical protein
MFVSSSIKIDLNQAEDTEPIDEYKLIINVNDEDNGL